MLLRRAEVGAVVDALNVLIANGERRQAEALIADVLKREPALRAKVDVLNTILEGMDATSADSVLDFVARKLREFQP